MERIQVTKLAQIPEADITFGDMTIFVGEQATGKSILLQLVKLVLDTEAIVQSLKRRGFDWQEEREKFLYLYFGEGMQSIWDSDATKIIVDRREFALDQVLSKSSKVLSRRTSGRARLRSLLNRRWEKSESLFLIPANRVITLKGGWPRAFTDYDIGDPYVVKQFSEELRHLMGEVVMSGEGTIFPPVKQMDRVLQEAIGESVFVDAKVKLDSSELRKRIVLDIEGVELPFMVWSAGQKEFMPLLMGLYLLMPSPRTQKMDNINWVVIEEPEVGLHPKAISVVLTVFLELMSRGYKVIVSTHSAQVLELVWAIQHLVKEGGKPTALLKMLDLRPNSFSRNMAQTALEKTFKTYYFSWQDKKVRVQDISTLDAEDPDEAVSDFGGLTTFGTKAAEVVSDAVWKGNS